MLLLRLIQVHLMAVRIFLWELTHLTALKKHLVSEIASHCLNNKNVIGSCGILFVLRQAVFFLLS